MADLKPSSKKTIQNILAESGERKIILIGPNNQKLQDSRFAIADAAADHVVIKLLGEDTIVIPYASIGDIKMERQVMTIRYR